MNTRILSVFAILSISASTLAQTTERVSVGAGGVQADAASTPGAISGDGRYVSFSSTAANLVSGDANGFGDAFERDRSAAVTNLVSTSSTGVQGNNQSLAGAISEDGRFEVFASKANNLVLGDTFTYQDVFVRDRFTGTVTRVSVNSSGNQADGPSSVVPNCISADGRFVVFTSDAFNLVSPEDFNETSDVYLRDLVNGVTTLVSVAMDGTPGGLSDAGTISADGRYVVFQSEAQNLVPGDTTNLMDVFVRDLQLGTTTLVVPGFYPSISPDGGFVTFVSYAGNLVPPASSDFFADVFVRDLLTGATEQMSVSSSGVRGNANSAFYIPSISSGGRYVAFGSAASNLVAGDTNQKIDIFVHDRQTHATTRVSVNSDGTQSNDNSYYSVISADGRFVTFQSLASNLVSGDTNGVYDVFVHDREGTPPIASFCFGDGSGTACPCGNSGSANNGCANSVSSVGAHLQGTGAPSVGTDTFVLAGSGMPNGGVLYFQGTAQQSVAFGDGLLCVAGNLLRLGVKINAAGASQYPGAGDVAVTAQGSLAAGDVRTYQGWYRDALVFCTPDTFNVTNGVQATWQP